MLHIGTTGNALLFFSCISGVAVFGLIVLSYAAHCFLVVLEGTAAGNDVVRWPDDPIFDWAWKPWFLAWLLAFWLVPLWLLVDGVLAPALEAQSVGFYPFLLASIWLLFPISLFSSLSANSRWVVFRPSILGRLARHGAALLVVYLVAGLLVVGAGALGYVALLSKTWLLLPLATMVTAAVVLLYARLFGRVAWLITYQPPAKPGKRRKRKKPTTAEGLGGGWGGVDEPEPPAPSDAEEPAPPPDAVEEEEEEEEDWRRPSKPYALASEQPQAPKRRARRPDLPDPLEAEAYDVHPDDAPPAPIGQPLDGYDPVSGPRMPGTPAQDERRPTEREIARRQLLAEKLLRPRLPEPPAHPLWSGVYTFPWYPLSLRAWINLSLIGLLLGAFLRGMLLTWPF